MRKRRTRQHIIEDLGFNHIERHILLAGFIMKRYSQYDYGYDGAIDTFNEEGEAENISIVFQLKSTDSVQTGLQKNAFVFDLSKQDLELWLTNRNMVILILFDAQHENAYFIDLQRYFKENRILLKNVRKFVRVYIPQVSVFDTAKLQDLRQIIINN